LSCNKLPRRLLSLFFYSVVFLFIFLELILWKTPNFNLCQLANTRDRRIIVGDLNIDLCKYSTHGPTRDYINNLLSNHFLLYIIMPTHFGDNSSTIIDHIYYKTGNQHNTVVNSGNLRCSVSDHLPNYIIIQADKIMKKEFARPLTSM